VSDYLTNLALRAAGVLGVASPEMAAAPGSEVPEPGLGFDESVHEEATARAHPASHEDRQQPDTRRPLVPERTGLAPQSAVLGGPSEAHVSPRQAPTTPGGIRDVHTEHHEIVREAAPTPTVEVHEIIREKEIVRETLIERELNIDTLPPPARVVPRPADAPLTPRGADVEAGSSVVPDVVIAVPLPAPPPTVFPAPPADIAPALRTERADGLTPEPPPEERRQPRPHRPEKTVSPARVTEPSVMVTAKPLSPARVTAPPLVTTRPPSAAIDVPVQSTAAESLVPNTEPPVVQDREPVLRPTPPNDSPVARPAERVTAPPGKAVEVTIGSIEIRTAAPSPPSKTPEPAPSHEPLEGFDAYRSVRRYSAWFRE
jgi:hypothetical protein